MLNKTTLQSSYESFVNAYDITVAS